MSSFPQVFHEARIQAESQGRRAIVCLLGPDMQAAFADLCGQWAECAKPLEKNGVWWPDFKPGDLGSFGGVRLRKMNHDGLAILT
jgi:hypothetical protein